MATLKLKGKKETVEVEFTKAVELKKRWLGTGGERKRDSSETFNLEESGISSTYGQIDWVDTKREYMKPPEIKISDLESKDFERNFIAPYLNERKYLTIERELDFLSDRGCIQLQKTRPDGQGRTISDFKVAIVGQRVDSYQNFMTMISAWKDYRSRFEFAQKKSLEDLEKNV